MSRLYYCNILDKQVEADYDGNVYYSFIVSILKGPKNPKYKEFSKVSVLDLDLMYAGFKVGDNIYTDLEVPDHPSLFKLYSNKEGE